MKYKIPNLFFKKKIIFNPESIDWDDVTVCVLCGKKSDCACKIHNCPCGKPATECEWPSNHCPCPECNELFINCNCIITIKKET